MTLASTEPRPKAAHLWERDDADFYIEPVWCAERLFAVEKFEGGVFDPACGIGTIPRAAQAAGLDADGADLIDRADGRYVTADFIGATEPVDNIVANPPFKLARPFAQRALRLARGKVALLLPTKWLSGDARSRWLETTPLRRVWFLCPRPSMLPGHLIVAGEKAGGGTVDYMWLVWERGFEGKPHVASLRRDGWRCVGSFPATSKTSGRAPAQTASSWRGQKPGDNRTRKDF
jgi:hypothetical protein